MGLFWVNEVLLGWGVDGATMSVDGAAGGVVGAIKGVCGATR